MNHARSLRIMAAVALVFGVALFAFGVSRERSSAEARLFSAEASSPEESSGHTETGEEGPEAGGSAETAAHAEPDVVLFGVDLESPTFVALAVIASVALAALLIGMRSRWVLAVVVAFAVVFAVADVREALKQIDESHTGIAAIAGGVLALHVVATVAALAVMRSDTEKQRT